MSVDVELLKRAARHGRSTLDPQNTMHPRWEEIFDLEARAENKETWMIRADDEWNEEARKMLRIEK